MRRVEPREDSTAEHAQVIEHLLSHPHGQVRISDENGISHVLPLEFVAVLLAAAGEFKQGHAIDLVSAAGDTLTPAETAAMLGVSRPTVLKLIQDGTLAADTVPGSSHRRLPRRAVEEFRDQRLALQEQLAEAAGQAGATGLFSRRAPRRKRT